MKLATKISVTLIGVLCLGALGSVEALLVAREMDRILTDLISHNVSSVRAAEELEIALLEQRGLVSSFILDQSNPRWVDELQGKRSSFAGWMERAEESAHTAEERQHLAELKRVYAEYDARRDEVIELVRKGRTEEATSILLRQVNAVLYPQAYAACEGFLDANERDIDQGSALARRKLRQASIAVALLVALTVTFGLGLLVLFFRGVVRPLRRMAEDARSFSGHVQPAVGPDPPQDELRAVGFYLRSLMSDVSETHSSLERSRAQLFNAEKLASLGKLAASVGHEIRNPLTSLEMRLHTVRLAVAGNPELEDDLRVVSEEVKHLEQIVRNLLEFARPPALNLLPHEVSKLLDKTLELCRHWLDEREIRVLRTEDPRLPPVRVDSEQIKQVFLNLLRNAVEAMEGGGTIRISAARGTKRGEQDAVIVRVQDGGPGVLPDVRERIFEPFFSTKEEGTGLGLCIAARIMAAHGGWLELEDGHGPGATFAVGLPAGDGDG
jgi:signal transduction histidine kinase